MVPEKSSGCIPFYPFPPRPRVSRTSVEGRWTTWQEQSNMRLYCDYACRQPLPRIWYVSPAQRLLEVNRVPSPSQRPLWKWDEFPRLHHRVHLPILIQLRHNVHTDTVKEVLILSKKPLVHPETTLLSRLEAVPDLNLAVSRNLQLFMPGPLFDNVIDVTVNRLSLVRFWLDSELGISPSEARDVPVVRIVCKVVDTFVLVFF